MTGDEDDAFYCETCDREVSREEVIRTKTIGGLDPERFQTFCCPDCGNRLETVFVADE